MGPPRGFRRPANCEAARGRPRIHERALRFQKALKCFNSYREERLRIGVRVGIHWGEVVRKEGDVLGNDVNIASRLESAATGGSVFISDAVREQLDQHVHSREIGDIHVKGIAEAIKVHEPYEIEIDFPAELDPVKSPPAGDEGRRQSPAEGEDARSSLNGTPAKGRSTPAGLYRYLDETLAALEQLCLLAERGETTIAKVREEIAERRRRIRGAASEGAATSRPLSRVQ